MDSLHHNTDVLPLHHAVGILADRYISICIDQSIYQYNLLYITKI